MTGISVTAVFIGVLLLLLVLVALTVYLFAARAVQERKMEKAKAYLSRNNERWYRVLRGMEDVSAEMVPKNKAELAAVEEIFRAYLTNVSGDKIRERIRAFADGHLAPFYRKKLKSRNWSERMNALYRIEDFGMESLLGDVHTLERKRLTADEWFQLLLIDLQFRPDGFIGRNADRLGNLSEYEARQLFFLMPEPVFEEASAQFGQLDPILKCGMVEVLGMRQDLKKLPFLEGLLDSEDPEIKIRVLRAIDAFGIRTPDRILERAFDSPVWEERFLGARMLRRVPADEAARYASRLCDDPSWLVREEVRGLLARQREAAEDLAVLR
ncbi:HEAT repeat domain-containing protein [Bhargavaea beijingensis]|uniref:HEAT repeat domain-containing protein n=1 Tax=Bhargavaea beijingensis TaxID=426756 RepID=A0ABX9ZET4_9BACL|nr:HEAT repeat domain-containing protein [Bhargavaea beijingensis]RSK35565.1 HEAT repeat domain-containing protein [Bhargavaea beijingensis]